MSHFTCQGTRRRHRALLSLLAVSAGLAGHGECGRLGASRRRRGRRGSTLTKSRGRAPSPSRSPPAEALSASTWPKTRRPNLLCMERAASDDLQDGATRIDRRERGCGNRGCALCSETDPRREPVTPPPDNTTFAAPGRLHFTDGPTGEHLPIRLRGMVSSCRRRGMRRIWPRKAGVVRKCARSAWPLAKRTLPGTSSADGDKLPCTISCMQV